MTENEHQQARAELIRGVSIKRMIADLTGKTYGQLVQAHLRNQCACLPAGIAASVAIFTPEERIASEAIIEEYNLKGYDAAFWASDAGEVLSSLSCALNDAVFPDTAEEVGVFNLFQLMTMNFAQMALEQETFREFVLAAPSQPTPPQTAEHGTITKKIGIAVSDHDAGRISRDHFISILQAAIDNGDILLETNKLHVVCAVFPLIDAGILRPSGHSAEFERRMSAEMLRQVSPPKSIPSKRAMKQSTTKQLTAADAWKRSWRRVWKAVAVLVVAGLACSEARYWVLFGSMGFVLVSLAVWAAVGKSATARWLADDEKWVYVLGTAVVAGMLVSPMFYMTANERVGAVVRLAALVAVFLALVMVLVLASMWRDGRKKEIASSALWTVGAVVVAVGFVWLMLTGGWGFSFR